MTVRIDVFTIFPDLVDHYAAGSVLGRARRERRPRPAGPRRAVGGGGPAPVGRRRPVRRRRRDGADAGAGLRRGRGGRSRRRAAAAAAPALAGRTAVRSSAAATELAGTDGGFSLLCGRYEGVDQRVTDHLVDGELSVGDVVLAGGELAALVVVEAVARLLPGVLGNDASATDESFTAGLLEYPQYTRPARFRGWEVPAVLRSGDHGEVERWRRAQALRRTLERRPDLVAARGGLTSAEVELLIGAGEVRLLAEHGYDA